MGKLFLSNIFFLLIINILIKPFYLFGIDAQVQNLIGPEQYGIYFSLFNLCFIFQIILDPGIQSFNVQNISSQQQKSISNIYNSLALKISLALIFIGLLALTAWCLDYDDFYAKVLLYLSINFICLSFYLFLRTHFSALGWYKTDSLFSGLDKLLMILLLGYQIYVVKEIDIFIFIQAQIVSYLISIAMVICFLYKHIVKRIKVSLQGIILVFKQSFPFAVTILLMTLYTRMDGIMIERLLNDGAYQAGVYAAGFRIYDALNMVGFLLASLLLPMFAKILNDRKALLQLLDLSFKFSVVTIALVAPLLYIYSEDILNLIYKDINMEYVHTFGWLILSFCCIMFIYVFGTLITSSAQLKKLNILFFIGILLNWSLNLWLIPTLKAEGAAMATFFTQFFIVVLQVILALKIFKLKISTQTLLSSLFLVISIIAIVVLSHVMEINWIITGLLSSIVVFVFIIFNKWIDLQMLKKSIF